MITLFELCFMKFIYIFENDYLVSFFWEWPIMWLFMVHMCKVIISPGVFSFFQWSKITKKSVCHAQYLRNHTSYDCHLWSTYVKWEYVRGFFHFFKILVFWVVRWGAGGKGKKWSKMTKIYVRHAQYLRNHTSYYCHLW